MNLLALADFNAVAAHGSFSAASRATGTPKATLSRRVRDLEAELGVLLIERGTRALRLTEEGCALRERTATALQGIDATGEAIIARSGRPRGRLCVSTPSAFAHERLGQLVADFIATYPEVTLDIMVEDCVPDTLPDDVDIAIRINPRPTSELVGHCFLKDDLVVVARPGIGATGEVPVVVLAGTRLSPVWKIEGPAGRLEITPRAVLRCSSILFGRDAVLAWAGAAAMPLRMVAKDVAAGRLVNWGRLANRRMEAWALHAARHLTSPKVKAFMDALLADRRRPRRA
jgi:DNA-binding transcriptional LysR family regulator